MLRLLRDRLADVVIGWVIYLLKQLPRQKRQQLAHFLAHCILSCAPKTKLRALDNVRQALPHLNDAEVSELVSVSYANIVFGVLDCFWMEELCFEYHISSEAKALLQSGCGVSLATMHMSCYEAIPQAVQRLTGRSTTLSNIPSFAASAQAVYQRLGIDCIHKKDTHGFIKLIQAAKRGQVVCLHSDHYANDIRLSFFGRDSGAPCGAAMLSAIAGVPLLFGYTLLGEDGQYHVYIDVISRLPLSREQAALQQAMESIYAQFERVIRLHPSQWYWSYNRWRCDA